MRGKSRGGGSIDRQVPMPENILIGRKSDLLNSSIGSVGFQSNNDSLLLKLKQQEKFKEMNLLDEKNYKVEADDDGGQIQQISGGFGDSTNIDEDTLKALVQQQKEAEVRAEANARE